MTTKIVNDSFTYRRFPTLGNTFLNLDDSVDSGVDELEEPEDEFEADRPVRASSHPGCSNRVLDDVFDSVRAARQGARPSSRPRLSCRQPIPGVVAAESAEIPCWRSDSDSDNQQSEDTTVPSCQLTSASASDGTQATGSDDESDIMRPSLEREVQCEEEEEVQETRARTRKVLEEGTTTLMIRNVPRKIFQRELVQEINATGYAGTYDFVYMPSYFKSRRGSGYAFINFKDTETATRFMGEWHNSQRWGMTGRCFLNISAADHQGKDVHIDKWCTSKTQRIKNPTYKPLIITEDSPDGEVLSSELFAGARDMEAADDNPPTRQASSKSSSSWQQQPTFFGESSGRQSQLSGPSSGCHTAASGAWQDQPNAGQPKTFSSSGCQRQPPGVWHGHAAASGSPGHPQYCSAPSKAQPPVWASSGCSPYSSSPSEEHPGTFGPFVRQPQFPGASRQKQSISLACAIAPDSTADRFTGGGAADPCGGNFGSFGAPSIPPATAMPPGSQFQGMPPQFGTPVVSAFAELAGAELAGGGNAGCGGIHDNYHRMVAHVPRDNLIAVLVPAGCQRFNVLAMQGV